MAAEKPSSKGQAWFCTTGLPSDIVIEVEEMAFHLHKFPLMSKSRKLHELITEQETNSTATAPIKASKEPEKQREPDHADEIEEVQCQISLPDFPGGSETFEMAAKFCYGVKIDLTASNVVLLRCAGEILEMTEEFSEDNLISVTELFFSQSVLKSLKESIKALKSCERVMSLAESLGIPQRCIDSIASRASSVDPALFGWPVSEATAAGSLNSKRKNNRTNIPASNQALWNGLESAARRKVGGGNNGESWFDELPHLSLPLFSQLVKAMQIKDLNPEIIESCLMHYAKKYIPGISRSNRKPSSSSSSVLSETEQKELLETVVSNLPLQKNSRSSTATRFLFGLLRTANILNASEQCRSTLERKIASQLEQATLDDLLIPSYSYLNETLYDVDCIERILNYFLDRLEEDKNRNGIEEEEIGGGHNHARSPSLMLVGKLIDGFLAEIASDANLKPDRFYNLAISLPEQARLFDDGLYRAVDVYLKAHSLITEAERDKICGILDCQKLTLEACTHAAQNERLPLRAVVQVLFFEQLQLRQAIAGTLIAAEADAARPSVLRQGELEEELEDGGGEAVAGSSGTWRAAVRENQVLRLDMDSMRTRVQQLERECSSMKKLVEKMDKEGSSGGGWKGSFSRKFGCKFKTQVCDSQEQAVVNGRKVRQQHRHHHHHQE